MSDVITAKAADSKFKPHPEGQYVGQCVDCIDLGEKVADFPGTPKYLAPNCALVFRTGERNDETGEYIDIAREFTVSMGEKANLRKFLEQWRGKPYTPEQIDAGVPLHKLTGNQGLLTVSQKVSGKNRAYANITACVGIPKQMQSSVTKYDDYVRADYWKAKKDGYAEEAARFRSDVTPPASNDDEFPDALRDGDDDLPF